MPETTTSDPAQCRCEPADQAVRVTVRGDWLLGGEVPDPGACERILRDHPSARLELKADALGCWDTTLISFLSRLIDAGEGGPREFDATALPEGARVQVLAPIVRGRKGEYKKELQLMQRQGGGAIVTMSSIGAHRYVEGLGGQGVVKAAVESIDLLKYGGHRDNVR